MVSERLYGIDKDIKAKIDSKYDPKRELEVREWIETVLEEQIEDEDLFEALKDGVILCRVLNKLRPNKQVKYNQSKMVFKQVNIALHILICLIEYLQTNIATFLNGAEEIGCPKFELFQTIDLYEKKHLNQVIDSFYSLSRQANKKGYECPMLGPKLADKHNVEFSEQQLRRASTYHRLQNGYNGGATLKGTNFGARRDIVGANPFK
ncbi:hypothetical protein CONCODRAFT_40959 [Conidiobolus coronatus NRRL 28638]|uniref:Calponin-homology (CH) domain-containing protein n=1 Tax=Conidiobolus coronatus (strain ATCC 28846 / CBS 209.66 / NRRL 28638) TaxID=796925 RepID=A0A137P2D4_CONC2|nr:hypothetical protein CONCODRAFT_40959 [Conidiobolus coronatus NRRL 28638]|eukprot:KXN69206.1 hypothetical protein CONCODRAFT_40959 [Conidiobolus coronatus NRRL 28638]